MEWPADSGLGLTGNCIRGGRSVRIKWHRDRTSNRFQGPVAQLVEHVTFNHRVAGSSPARLTI
jgi:hypothetical protein